MQNDQTAGGWGPGITPAMRRQAIHEAAREDESEVQARLSALEFISPQAGLKTSRVNHAYGQLVAGQPGAYGQLLGELIGEVATLVKSLVLRNARLSPRFGDLVGRAYAALARVVHRLKGLATRLDDPRQAILWTIERAILAWCGGESQPAEEQSARSFRFDAASGIPPRRKSVSAHSAVSMVA